MKRALPIFGAVALFGLLAAPLGGVPGTGGTTLRRMSLQELNARAEAIVVARVVDNTAAWHPKMALIWTSTRLRIEESWKGSVGDKLVVTEPGGRVYPIVQRVPGMARFRPGERVVLFLHRDVLGQWRTLGCCQGRLPLFTDPEGVTRIRPSAVTRHVVKDVKDGKTSTPRLDALRAQLAAKNGEGR